MRVGKYGFFHSVLQMQEKKKERDSAALRLRHLGALPGGSLQGKGTAAAAGGRLSVSGSGPLRKQAFDGPETKNSRLLSQPAAVPFSCGESEIRTRDTLLGYTRFPGVPLQPLEHLSNTYPGPFGQNRTAKVVKNFGLQIFFLF